jgi:hypothetical protein
MHLASLKDKLFNFSDSLDALFKNLNLILLDGPDDFASINWTDRSLQIRCPHCHQISLDVEMESLQFLEINQMHLEIDLQNGSCMNSS